MAMKALQAFMGLIGLKGLVGPCRTLRNLIGPLSPYKGLDTFPCSPTWTLKDLVVLIRPYGSLGALSCIQTSWSYEALSRQPNQVVLIGTHDLYQELETPFLKVTHSMSGFPGNGSTQ